MTDNGWPLAQVGALHGAHIYVRCGQGTRRPKDGWFAYFPDRRLTLRAAQKYVLLILIRRAIGRSA